MSETPTSDQPATDAAPDTAEEQSTGRTVPDPIRPAHGATEPVDGEQEAPQGEGGVAIMDEPGGEMTSTGDQIVENDLSEDEFLDALEGTMKEMDEGKIIEGVIVKVDPDEVLLDIGWKSEGVIPVRELSIKSDVDPGEVVQVGDVVEALIMDEEDEQGRLTLSKKRAQYERAWGTIQRIYEEDGTVVGTVIEVVKGGLILDIGLRGFLPASLVEMRRVRDLNPYVGTDLECKIIELDRNRNNVVLSRRKFLEETQAEFRQEFLSQLQKGEIRKGVVSSIVNFGAFVDLGGVDGLVHVSELAWSHIDHPSEIVEVGEEIEVEVLDVDLERERVSLSLKATQEDPWQQFARDRDIGDVIEGEVTKLVPFGAFVKVAEGIEGLVHISELADRHVEVPEAVVNVGDEIDVKVIDIDTVRRRISLSLKQVRGGGGTGEPAEDREPEPGFGGSGGRQVDEARDDSAMAGALADAGLAPSESGQGPSPEEMALADAELPDHLAPGAGGGDESGGDESGDQEEVGTATDEAAEASPEAAEAAGTGEADEADGAEDADEVTDEADGADEPAGSGEAPEADAGGTDEA